MKKLVMKLAVAVLGVVALAGCAQMGDNGGLTGLGQVARNTCRQPMPVYTKGEMPQRYTK